MDADRCVESIAYKLYLRRQAGRNTRTTPEKAEESLFSPQCGECRVSTYRARAWTRVTDVIYVNMSDNEFGNSSHVPRSRALVVMLSTETQPHAATLRKGIRRWTGTKPWESEVVGSQKARQLTICDGSSSTQYGGERRAGHASRG